MMASDMKLKKIYQGMKRKERQERMQRAGELIGDWCGSVFAAICWNLGYRHYANHHKLVPQLD